ncbi:SDR family NAD(P)-dependent oxidoreductase [Pseudooceanicola sp.]|uniref:SDR family NAD(P)-dependent oxidoreductase n=1 Tax=Pseudooceanicola sp. TaxID=1914328 RepID=UPI0026315427|nr:SDR family NAD(P)-dependent oxidoreductase [Pseudooceanicola sp.]MDF1856589.1 SDR family NAD(P)-dependent oxidoreductase [Pseudooceanicola sp.]
MSQDKMLAGKVAIITGAGRGIGRDMALTMASRGARVIVNDPGAAPNGEAGSEDNGPAADVVREIRAAGGEAEANFGSVAVPADAKSMIDQAMDTWGQLDCVVNNAGILRDVIFHKLSIEDWHAVIDVHLNGSFYMAHAAAPIFREKQNGCFIHFTSTSGLIGNFGQANYSAAKLGIVGLSKSIALDMSRYNVTSNCIAPFAWSRLIGTIPINSDADAKRIEKAKQSTPAKIAPLAAALASDAGKETTGQIFAVRMNEIFLMSQSRPIRSVQMSDGWTPEAVAETALPALKGSYYNLDRSGDVFTWDPI